MAKVKRNAPCPCGSGKKYKKCCLLLHQESSAQQQDAGGFFLTPGFTELDDLSNSVVDLIKEGRLDKAEAVCHELLSRYPDQIDGTERLAAVYEARGEKKKAAEHYRKAAQFAQDNPGFDQEMIDWYLSKAEGLEANE
ncbi:MAG: SEC-C metal-binding domain-containing protein [Pseudomonadota bacterium]